MVNKMVKKAYEGDYKAVEEKPLWHHHIRYFYFRMVPRKDDVKIDMMERNPNLNDGKGHDNVVRCGKDPKCFATSDVFNYDKLSEIIMKCNLKLTDRIYIKRSYTRKRYPLGFRRINTVQSHLEFSKTYVQPKLIDIAKRAEAERHYKRLGYKKCRKDKQFRIRAIIDAGEKARLIDEERKEIEKNNEI